MKLNGNKEMMMALMMSSTTMCDAFSLGIQQKKTFITSSSSSTSILHASSKNNNGGVFVENEMFAESSSTSSVSQDNAVQLPAQPVMARPAPPAAAETAAPVAAAAETPKENPIELENKLLRQKLEELERKIDNVQQVRTIEKNADVSIAAPTIARPDENTKIALANPKAKAQVTTPPPTLDTNEDDDEVEQQQSVWERNKAVDIQGGSLRTWSFAHQHKMDMIQVHMKTDGRPMNANVDLWQGPDNVPQKVAVYVEDGRERPFRCFVATPYGQNSISIRNTNTLEYPIQAVLEGGKVGMDDPETKEKMKRIETTRPKMCQGGAVITERFEPDVQSVQIFLSSEGRPLQCRIELLQGPNNVKQVMEVYSEEGSVRPFYCIVETPGYSNGVVRIVNSSTMEFPFSAICAPWDIEKPGDKPLFELSGGHNGDAIGGFDGNGNNNNSSINLRGVGGAAKAMGGMLRSSSTSTAMPPPLELDGQSKKWDSNFFLDKDFM